MTEIVSAILYPCALVLAAAVLFLPVVLIAGSVAKGMLG